MSLNPSDSRFIQQGDFLDLPQAFIQPAANEHKASPSGISQQAYAESLVVDAHPTSKSQIPQIPHLDCSSSVVLLHFGRPCPATLCSDWSQQRRRAL